MNIFQIRFSLTSVQVLYGTEIRKSRVKGKCSRHSFWFRRDTVRASSTCTQVSYLRMEYLYSWQEGGLFTDHRLTVSPRPKSITPVVIVIELWTVFREIRTCLPSFPPQNLMVLYHVTVYPAGKSPVSRVSYEHVKEMEEPAKDRSSGVPGLIDGLPLSVGNRPRTVD